MKKKTSNKDNMIEASLKELRNLKKQIETLDKRRHKLLILRDKFLFCGECDKYYPKTQCHTFAQELQKEKDSRIMRAVIKYHGDNVICPNDHILELSAREAGMAIGDDLYGFWK